MRSSPSLEWYEPADIDDTDPDPLPPVEDLAIVGGVVSWWSAAMVDSDCEDE